MINRTIFVTALALSGAVLVPAAIVIVQLNLTVPVAVARDLPRKIPAFQFEREAQQHCPDDSVVWATAASGIYNASTELWYGRTSDGAFGCLHEAEDAGYRAQHIER